LAKTATKKRRAVVEEEENVNDMFLQDILALPEPDRTNTLNEWVEAADYDVEYGGTVKIGNPDKKPMKVTVGKETFNIPPSGRRVERRMAIKLLLDYGSNGTYLGRDQATGMTPMAWQFAKPEMKEFFGNYAFNFILNHLEQLPDGNPSVEEESEE
jgi:hypothetical protein